MPQVTAVFCQSAIESAQKDHATVVQNMLDNKESHLRKLGVAIFLCCVEVFGVQELCTLFVKLDLRRQCFINM